jgi:4-diphosphocytidyl-2-C-methyl-D-erythritol kinase
VSSKAPFVELAPAKINLTLRVLCRRPDGYHDIESLVAFATLHDRLTLDADKPLALAVGGEFAGACGPETENLVHKAATALGGQVQHLKLGRFTLTKHLPVAAGLGGGSSDAAAALRLLARSNDLAIDDPRLTGAARMTGADIPVCLDPRARIMRGIGEILSRPFELPKLHALLVNPGIAVPTAGVFAAHANDSVMNSSPSREDPAISLVEGAGSISDATLMEALRLSANDLEAPAVALYPVIGDVLGALRALPCTLARMSGSGATCFALFNSFATATMAATALKKHHPDWWIRETTLGAS